MAIDASNNIPSLMSGDFQVRQSMAEKLAGRREAQANTATNQSSTAETSGPDYVAQRDEVAEKIKEVNGKISTASTAVDMLVNATKGLTELRGIAMEYAKDGLSTEQKAELRSDFAKKLEAMTGSINESEFLGDPADTAPAGVSEMRKIFSRHELGNLADLELGDDTQANLQSLNDASSRVAKAGMEASRMRDDLGLEASTLAREDAYLKSQIDGADGSTAESLEKAAQMLKRIRTAMEQNPEQMLSLQGNLPANQVMALLQ